MAQRSHRPIIAMPIGDPNGVGPEIALKAAADPSVQQVCQPLIVGDQAILSRLAESLDCKLDGIDFHDVPVLGERQKPGEVTAAAGAATVSYAQAAIQLAVDGRAAAVVAAPHNETAVAAAGISFTGYPGLLAEATGTDPDNVFLMLVTPRFRIVHQTLHVGLRTALDSLTEERVYRGILACYQALKIFQINQPKIGVFGINPHAGENGLFGDDDERITRPAADRARKDGMDVVGPAGADVMLQEQACDGYLAMFHDQGHIPAKLEGRDAAVGLSIGTPILFSSVAHGSAHDIAGLGIADARPMTNVLRRVAEMVQGNNGL